MRWKDISVFVRVPIFVIIILLSFMTLAPFAYFLALSVSSFADTYQILFWPKEFRWQNYLEAWQLTNLGVHYRASIYVTVLSLLLNLSVGTMMAYAMARFKFPGREAIYTLLLAGLILSGTSLLIPLFLNARLFGMLNQWWTLPVIYATLGLPFTVLILRAFFETLPSELIDAATMDGSNPLQTFFFIMLPSSLPAVMTVGLFQFIRFWGEFILAISLVSNDSFRTLPAGLARLYGEYHIDYPVLAAALVMSFLPVVFVYIFTQRKFTRGITAGAIQ